MGRAEVGRAESAQRGNSRKNGWGWGAGGGRDGAGTSDWDPECLTKTDSGHITEAETGSLFCPTLRCKCVGNND